MMVNPVKQLHCHGVKYVRVYKNEEKNKKIR